MGRAARGESVGKLGRKHAEQEDRGGNPRGHCGALQKVSAEKLVVADTLTADERSERMSRVRGRGNLSTELRMIALMRAAGITGWRRGASLPGKPDFIFRAAKVAVFVDGCFWHGCPHYGRTPKTRVAFWAAKLARNAQRDRTVSRALRASGWTVLRVWECAIMRQRSGRTVGRIARALASA